MLGSRRFFEFLALHSALSQIHNQIADHTRQGFERFFEQVGVFRGQRNADLRPHKFVSTSHEPLVLLTELLIAAALESFGNIYMIEFPARSIWPLSAKSF
jgi:hypothetical protein